jgi:predicted Zn-dependent protease
VLATVAVSACATTRPLDAPALRALAERETTALLQRTTAYDDPALTAYLAEIGERLYGATLSFHVLRDPTLGLFALPDGQVFVHTGLLAAAENEAQLAALLGHEIAHVLLRDAVDSGAPPPVAPSLDPETAASPTAAAIHARDLRLTARAALDGYGGERERAADVMGLAAAARGGWDPKEAPVAFVRLAARALQGGPREVFLFGNRSWLAERIETTRALAVTMLPGASDSEAFARLLRPLVRENAREEMRRGDFEAAERELRRVLTVAPDDALALLALGDLHRLRAQRATSDGARAIDLAQAREAYARALAADPTLAAAHRQLGLLRYAEDDLSGARAEFERYLALAPAAPDAARIAEYVTELGR